MRSRKPASSNPATHLASAGLGGVAGFAAARVFRSQGATEALADALIRQASVSVAGPVIAAGVLGFAVVIAAVAIPAVVVFTIKHRESKS